QSFGAIRASFASLVARTVVLASLVLAAMTAAASQMRRPQTRRRTRSMTTLLSPGDKFPRLDLALVGGGTLALPDAFTGRSGVVLFNRGAWCPFCIGQLRAFQRAADKLDTLGVSVASVSVDDEATAAGLIAANDLAFPVGHSADARALAAATGAF